MQNLEQIRSAAAMAAADTKEGKKFLFIRSDVAGFPALIITNGLLASMAYANEGGDSRKGLKAACEFTSRHLANPLHGITVLEDVTTIRGALDKLGRAPATSSDLQRATSEALAFFGYLKRFAVKTQPSANAVQAGEE